MERVGYSIDCNLQTSPLDGPLNLHFILSIINPLNHSRIIKSEKKAVRGNSQVCLVASYHVLRIEQFLFQQRKSHKMKD